MRSKFVREPHIHGTVARKGMELTTVWGKIEIQCSRPLPTNCFGVVPVRMVAYGLVG